MLEELIEMEVFSTSLSSSNVSEELILSPLSDFELMISFEQGLTSKPKILSFLSEVVVLQQTLSVPFSPVERRFKLVDFWYSASSIGMKSSWHAKWFGMLHFIGDAKYIIVAPPKENGTVMHSQHHIQLYHYLIKRFT